MKSDVILKSEDRVLFGITIRQNTKESMLSVTDLQQAYETARWQYGWSDRRINNILTYNPVKERVYYLLFERGLIKTSVRDFMEMCENEGLVKILKGLGLWKARGRGANKTVMADPYIWVLLALELNPMIYAKVIMWLTDSLIFDRIDAGGEYKPMNSKIKQVVENPDYAKYARLINIKVFGRHMTGIRDLAGAKDLKTIAIIEKFIIQAVDLGLVKDEDSLMNVLSNFKV